MSDLINFNIYREDTPQSQFQRLIGSTPLFLTYISQLNVFCLTDQGGFVLDKADIKQLIDELDKFFEVYPDEIIETANNEKAKSIFPDQSSGGIFGNGPGYIYLMKNAKGWHKIGLSIDPNRRVQQIRRRHKGTEIIYTFPADEMGEAEAELHNRFTQQHIKGEWFDLSEKDVNYILSLSEYKDGQFISNEANNGR